MKKFCITLVVILLLVSLMAGCNEVTGDTEPENSAGTSSVVSDTGSEEIEEAEAVYIEAPYVAVDEAALTSEILDPVYYENADGPTIGVTLVGVIQIGDKYFKDSDNDQELDIFEDWRLTAEERADDAISKMTLEAQAGLTFNAVTASPAVSTMEEAMVNGKIDFLTLSGTIDFDETNPYAGFGDPFSYQSVLNDNVRSGVLRANPEGELVAYFNNHLNQTAEYVATIGAGITIPYTMIANPIGTGYPKSMGMAAAVMGDVDAGGDYSLITDYAVNDAMLWTSKGLDSMYGPMIDIVSDPRWNRFGETYGEVPEVVANIITELVKGYQNGTEGLDKDSIALSVKHFPGDAAAYNGFESHNYIGQWRLYPTEGSLEKYHLVAFQAAFDANVGSVMPGYSMPSQDGVRSVLQTYRGVEINAEEIGNAYNSTILQTLLRDTMGFTGYVNSDTGIITDKDFGAEDLTTEQKVATVIKAGIDVISNGNEAQAVINAVNSGELDKEALDRANKYRIIHMMETERFENPYVDPDNAAQVEEAVFADTADDKLEANRKSFVLLKNHEGALPLTDTSKKVYVQVLKGASTSRWGASDDTDPAEKYKAMFTDGGFTLVDDYTEADIVFLYVDPSLNNTQQMAVIDLVEGLQVDERNPDSTTQEKTGNQIICSTVPGINEVPAIAEAVHANGGKVVAMVDFSNPWIMTNLEPYCDGLMADFGGSSSAMMDVLDGTYNPTGKLPITLVSSNEVISVEPVTEGGMTYEKCASPNDVPGYDKDQYIDEAILAEVNGGSYAYYDADGNYYRAWFGLSY